MTHLRRIALLAYAGLMNLLPGEFKRRHTAEMRLDFADDVQACATAADLAVTAGHAYGDIAISVAREWCGSEGLRLLIYAGLAHGGIWLIGVAVAAWQWPGGPPLYPLIVIFAALSVPGIAVTVWRQRVRMHRAGGCSLSVAEID
jgi:hypothetical protein